MWIIIAYSLLTNHVLSYLSGAPFIAHLRLLPTTLLALKLIIKTNLVSWEITPTLAEEWHQLQVSHCALRMIHSSVLSFLLILSATHSISWFFFFFLPHNPHLPLTTDECAANRGFNNVFTVNTGHSLAGCMNSTGKFNSLAFSVVTKKDGVFLQISISFTQSYLSTWLWVNPVIAQWSPFQAPAILLCLQG